MDCTIRAAKTKALISFAVTAKLICIFVFAYAKCLFSHDAAQLFMYLRRLVLFLRIYSIIYLIRRLVLFL